MAFGVSRLHEDYTKYKDEKPVHTIPLAYAHASGRVSGHTVQGQGRMPAITIMIETYFSLHAPTSITLP